MRGQLFPRFVRAWGWREDDCKLPEKPASPTAHCPSPTDTFVPNPAASQGHAGPPIGSPQPQATCPTANGSSWNLEHPVTHPARGRTGLPMSTPHHQPAHCAPNTGLPHSPQQGSQGALRFPPQDSELRNQLPQLSQMGVPAGAGPQRHS